MNASYTLIIYKGSDAEKKESSAPVSRVLCSY